MLCVYILCIYIMHIYIHIYMSILTHIGGSDAVVHTHCIRSSKSNAVLNTHCPADHLWGWMKTVPYLMVASSRKHEILFKKKHVGVNHQSQIISTFFLVGECWLVMHPVIVIWDFMLWSLYISLLVKISHFQSNDLLHQLSYLHSIRITI